MTKRVAVTFGGTEYQVPLFTLDQLQEISDVTQKYTGGKQAGEVLKIALRDAEPKCENPGAVRTTPKEVGDALSVILEASGMKDANPPKAAADA